MKALEKKVVFVTGASRGIGLAIARRAARDGARVAIAAKSDRPHKKLPGTIYSAAGEIEAAGGEALPIRCDVRDEASVEAAICATVERFGRLDVLVNNAGAITLKGTRETPTRRFDLLHDVNVRGAWICARTALPHLERSDNPHILNLAPPLNLAPRWLAPHLAYTLSKYGMSLATLGLAEELREEGIAVNALWPRSVILTSALNLLPEVDHARCRKPEIVADAAHWIITRPSRELTGRLLLDEEALREAGIGDFSSYAVEPGGPLELDLYVDP